MEEIVISIHKYHLRIHCIELILHYRLYILNIQNLCQVKKNNIRKCRYYV